LSATIPSNLTSIPDGMSIVVKSTAANTGAATLNLTLGSTVTGAIPIVLSNDAALVGGEIPGAGYPITLSYSSTYNAWVITDGSVNFSLYAPINSPTFTGTPAAPTPSNSDSTTKLATTAYVQNNLANYAPIYSPSLTGTPTAPTPSTGTSNTQLATTAFVNQASSLSTNGYQKFPSGLIIQWGTFTTSSGGYTNLTFPIAFPNALLSITANDVLSSTQIYPVNINMSGKTTTYVPVAAVSTMGSYNSNDIVWIVIGY